MKCFQIKEGAAVLFLLSLMVSCRAPYDVCIGSVSDPSTELMSHDFRYVGDYKGFRYGLYNAGYESTKEHPKNLDIDLKISRWKTVDLEHRNFIPVRKAGEGITDDFRPPYDPTGVIEGSTLHILFCPGVDGRSAYVHVPFDLERNELGKEEVMTLDGRQVTVANVLDIYKEKTGKDIPWHSDGGPKTAFGIGMNVEVVSHDGYYYSVISAVASGFTAIIVRSRDLVHWESVCIPDFSSVGLGTTFWEGVVHPLRGDVFAFAIRVQSENGVIYGTWNSATGVLSNLRLVDGAITARPEFFDYKGSTYLSCNTSGPSEVEGYGSVYRATTSFYKVSDDGSSLEFVRSKSVPEGIHYPTYYVERGRLFILYSTDSRRLDPREARSNIAIEQIVL